MKVLLTLIFILTVTKTKRHCRKETRRLMFYKVKSCHRSTLPVIFWANTDKPEDCESYARVKNGLAFNFSPPEARQYNKGFTLNCQVLGCPEIAESLTLIEDVGFDYYSAYGNWTSTENATCIKSVGLFSMFFQKQNYTNSIDVCQKMGAEIADVTSEVRTKYLSRIVNDTLDSWYKVAYVGLDDLEQEGNFITSFHLLLRCIPFRSWAPGHPIFYTENHDCVVLDDTKLWRVVECKRKFPVLCEFYPEKPGREDLELCNKITNTIKKRLCITREKNMRETVTNLPRIEQCAIWSAEGENEKDEHREYTNSDQNEKLNTTEN